MVPGGYAGGGQEAGGPPRGRGRGRAARAELSLLAGPRGGAVERTGRCDPFKGRALRPALRLLQVFERTAIVPTGRADNDLCVLALSGTPAAV